MAAFKRSRHRDASVQPKTRHSRRSRGEASPPSPSVWSPNDALQGEPSGPWPEHGQLDSAAIAEVVGPLAIPQITVGQPSPLVQPTVIAADYRSFPFRPDLVIDGWSTNAMTVRGASQRGHLHRYNGAPRQDDFAVHALSDGRVVVVVADGVSAAQQSHIGANSAVKYAAAWLCTHLNDDTVQTDWVMLMKSTAWELAEQAQALFRLSEPDPVVAEEQLATTLVCAVVEPLGSDSLRAHLVGIGDSAAWLLSPTGFRDILEGKTVSSDGVTSSAVTGLPRVPADLSPVVVEITRSDVLLIGTDGVGDPLGSGQGGIGNLLREVLTPSPPSLIEFAHALDFSRENFDDDRTLVAVWPRRSPVAQ